MSELEIQTKQEATAEEHTRPGRTYVPSVDIAESDDQLWLWADMPGVDEKSVHVHLEDGVVTIEGRVSVEDYENLTPLYTEYNVGNFERRFRVSDAIDTERITARMRDGVLELQLPRAQSARPRRIEIQAS